MFVVGGWCPNVQQQQQQPRPLLLFALLPVLLLIPPATTTTPTLEAVVLKCATRTSVLHPVMTAAFTLLLLLLLLPRILVLPLDCVVLARYHHQTICLTNKRAFKINWGFAGLHLPSSVLSRLCLNSHNNNDREDNTLGIK